jgi:hypothetical protein
MKIAFMLVGQLRTFECTIPSILQQLEYFRSTAGVECVDVFCHTWTESGVNAEWKNQIHSNHGSPEEVKDKVVAALQPKLIQVNEYIEDNYIPNADMLARFKDKKDHWYGWRGSRTIGMYYSLYACNELKKQYELDHGFKYDLVIKTRYDIEYRRPAITRDMIHQLDYKSMWMHDESSSANINDNIFWTNSELMDKICALYTCFDEYYKQGVIIFGETVLSHHLTAKNIPVKRMYIPFFLRFAHYDQPNIEHESFEV